MFWDKFKRVHCVENGCFCESVRQGIIAQPSASLSMLPVIFLGIYILLKEKRIFPKMLGISTLILGVGSLVFHATMTHLGATLDWLGMYLVILTFLLWSLNEYKKLSERQNIILLLTLGLFFTTISFFQMTWGREIFGGILLLTLLLNIKSFKKRKQKAKYYALGIITFFLAFGLHQLDEKRIICSPNSLFQLHSFWHFFIALAIYFYYKYKL